MRVWDSRWGCEVGGVYTREDGSGRVVVTAAKPDWVRYRGLGSNSCVGGAMGGPGAQQRFRLQFKRWTGVMRMQGSFQLAERELRAANGRWRERLAAVERERNVYATTLQLMTTAGTMDGGDELARAYLECKGDPYEKLQALAEAGLRLGQQAR